MNGGAAAEFCCSGLMAMPKADASSYLLMTRAGAFELNELLVLAGSLPTAAASRGDEKYLDVVDMTSALRGVSCCAGLSRSSAHPIGLAGESC